MSHYIMFSLAGAHISNARKEINSMHNVSGMKYEYLNYDEEAHSIFKDNILHGILAIYSINAALESIITIIDQDIKLIRYCRNKKGKLNFYEKINTLKDINVISNLKYYDSCIKLRKYRNIISHWDLNGIDIMAVSIGYLPFMFGDSKYLNDKEELISRLTQEKLEEYYYALDNMIKDICNSEMIQENKSLLVKLESIMAGQMEIECG